MKSKARDAAEAEADRMRAAFEAGEDELAELETQLDERTGRVPIRHHHGEGLVVAPLPAAERGDHSSARRRSFTSANTVAGGASISVLTSTRLCRGSNKPTTMSSARTAPVTYRNFCTPYSGTMRL